MSRGPVIDIYADTQALEVDCPDCSRPAGSYCVLPGTEIVRKVPCGSRVREALRKGAGR